MRIIKGKYLVKHIQESTYEGELKSNSIEYTCNDLIEASKLLQMIDIFANKKYYNDFSINYIES